MHFFDGQLRQSQIYEVKVKVEARNTVKTGVFCTPNTGKRGEHRVLAPLLRRRKRRQKRTRRRSRGRRKAEKEDPGEEDEDEEKAEEDEEEDEEDEEEEAA